MMIRKDNQEDIRHIPVHDMEFHGFGMGYPDKSLQLDLVDRENERAFQLTFRDVAAMQWQGLNLWNGGCTVYGLWPDDDPTYFRQMQQRESDQSVFLCEDDVYFSIVLALISGDELKITCREMEIRIYDFPFCEDEQ